MDTAQVSAPSRASSRVPGRIAAFGVTHVKTVHRSRFTVVGNHLAQHREMSMAAIGLAVHIQSLPEGAKVGIKALAERFPDSEARIAETLRELEEFGYLERTRVRLPSGKLVTRTVSYNQPRAVSAPQEPEPVPPVPEPEPEPESEPAPAPEPAPVKAPPPPLPQPQAHDLERHRLATDLLAGLRRHEPRLLLAEQDVRRLAPAVAAWLERDADPDAVRQALTANLPAQLKQPAGLLAHRLTALLPPPLPAAPPGPNRPDPLQNCDTCDRAFRSPEPGDCPGCRTRFANAA
ncbi:helix-turn-helix domain-containing protein [Streptomyces sp. NPDC045431]|uniref:helix-turn-helix domain-containing protein n=1 Tax=Streptomyces sp. NPDC045431 TaxID=3155613 RepID=UPI0033DE5441